MYLAEDIRVPKLVRSLGTPHVLDSLELRLGVEYPDGADETIAGDERRARFAARLIEWKTPRLTLAARIGVQRPGAEGHNLFP